MFGSAAWEFLEEEEEYFEAAEAMEETAVALLSPGHFEEQQLPDTSEEQMRQQLCDERDRYKARFAASVLGRVCREHVMVTCCAALYLLVCSHRN